MLIAGNWKMNKTASETAEFCSSLERRVDGLPREPDISVFPPYTSLAAAVTGLADSGSQSARRTCTGKPKAR